MNLTANAAILSGIAPDGVAAAYRSRKLEALSDVDLVPGATPRATPRDPLTWWATR